MASVQENLIGARAAIESIAKITGITGLALGVVHHGQPVHTFCLGHRDVENGLPTTPETIHYIASLTKLLTASAVGILVDEGKLGWTTLIKDVLPDFALPLAPEIEANATVEDMLSHRTGLERGDPLFIDANNAEVLKAEDSLATISQLPAVAPFRASYRYSNFAFEIMGKVIERVSGQTYKSFLGERLFGPLDMKRTFDVRDCDGAENVAQAYTAGDGGRSYLISRPMYEQGRAMNTAGGIQSCIHDMMLFYSALMRALNHQRRTGATQTPGLPFRQMVHIFSKHTATVPQEEEEEKEKEKKDEKEKELPEWYGQGVALATLPVKMSTASFSEGNEKLLPMVPPMGADDGSHHEIAWHHGVWPGFFSAMYLFPESESAVVVMANTMPISDGVDWIGRTVIESLCPWFPAHDYVQVAREAVKLELAIMPDIRAALQEERKRAGDPPPPPSLPLSGYEGIYKSPAKTLAIHVSVHADGELCMSIQGNSAEEHRMRHHLADEWAWDVSTDELVRRGMFARPNLSFWKLKFDVPEDHGGRAASLLWGCWLQNPKGVLLFTRDDTCDDWTIV